MYILSFFFINICPICVWNNLLLFIFFLISYMW